MNKELYDKILVLMAIDSAYEKDFGCRYVEQEVFGKLLAKASVGQPNMDYIEERLEAMMDDLEQELLKDI